MRRLLFLVCGLVWVDTMLYAALTPLLPRFTHDLHLSKTGAGVLVAAYAAGALIGGLPGGVGGDEHAGSRLGEVEVVHEVGEERCERRVEHRVHPDERGDEDEEAAHLSAA